MPAKRTHIVSVLTATLALQACFAVIGAGSAAARIAPTGAERLMEEAFRHPAENFNRLIRREVRRLRSEERARRHRKREDVRSAALPDGVSAATLNAIAACESGSNPTAVSAGGTYRGLYQFDQGTWESVGGRGDPAAAPPAEQTYRAALLYARSGSSPWPVCG